MSRADGHPPSGSSLRDNPVAARRLVAVTRDVALEAALRELAQEIPVVIVDDLARLSDELLRHGSNLALVDAAAASTPLQGVVDALIGQFPDLRLMIAGHAAEQSLLASRIANESVFRFVHKPASSQRLRLFIDADARATSRRREPDATVSGATPRPPSKMAFLLAGLVAVVVATVAAWLFWPHGAAARLNARDLARVDAMLEQAGLAMKAGRFVSFDGTSAAELYRDVLQLDAVNEPGRTGLDRALDGAIDGARRALADGRLDAATNTMEAVRVIAPGHPGLKELVAQVEAETRRELADSKAREAMAERQAQIRAAVDRMEASIARGALLEPEADSASSAFQSAQALSPGDPAVRTARGELTTALVSAGEKAVAAHRLAEARRHADAAGHINSSAPGLAALLQHIEEAAAPPAVRSAAAPRPEPEPASIAAAPPPAPAPVASTSSMPVAAVPVEAPAATAPTPEPQPSAAPAPLPVPVAVAAADAWVPGEGVVSSRQLKAVRQVPVEYPLDALNSLISGWVEMEFTVARDGSVKDLKVTASQPAHTFDSAALSAQRKFRYQPVLKDGQPVEQRARTRINFTAKDR